MFETLPVFLLSFVLRHLRRLQRGRRVAGGVGNVSARLRRSQDAAVGSETKHVNTDRTVIDFS